MDLDRYRKYKTKKCLRNFKKVPLGERFFPEHVGYVDRVITKPFWIPNKRFNPAHPNFWITKKVEGQKDNAPIFYMDQRNLPRYINRIFDIEIAQKPMAVFIDTGAFICIMPKWFADEHLSEYKRHNINISGIAQVQVPRKYLKDVPFLFNGREFKADFMLDDDVEQIFKAQIVLGKETFNQILHHHYGIYFENMFDSDALKKFELKLQKNWLDSRSTDHLRDQKKVFQVLPADYPVFIDDIALYAIYLYYRIKQELPPALIRFLTHAPFIIFDETAMSELRYISEDLTKELIEISNKAFNLSEAMRSGDSRQFQELYRQYGNFTQKILHFRFVKDDYVFILENSFPTHVLYKANKLAVLTSPDRDSKELQYDRIELYSSLLGNLSESNLKKDIRVFDISPLLLLSKNQVKGKEPEPLVINDNPMGSIKIRDALGGRDFIKPFEASEVLAISKNYPKTLYSGFPAEVRLILSRYSYDQFRRNPDKAPSEVVSEIMQKFEHEPNEWDEYLGIKDIKRSLPAPSTEEEIKQNKEIEKLNKKILQKNTKINSPKSRTKRATNFADLHSEFLHNSSMLEEYLTMLVAVSNYIYDQAENKAQPISIFKLNEGLHFAPIGLSMGMVKELIKELEYYTDGKVKMAKEEKRTITRKFSLEMEGVGAPFDLYFKKYRSLENNYIRILKSYFDTHLKSELPESRVLVNELMAQKELFRQTKVSAQKKEIKKEIKVIINSLDLLAFQQKFAGTSTQHIKKNIIGWKNDPKILTNIEETDYPDLRFTSRILWSAANDIYNPFRTWIIRNEDLRLLCTLLPDFFDSPIDPDWKHPHLSNADIFLSGKPFRRERIGSLRKPFACNIFGIDRAFSMDFLNNHLLQLKNLLFSRLDFKLSALQMPEMSPLQLFMKEVLDAFLASPPSPPVSEFIKQGLKDFKRKKSGEYLSIPRDKLLAHLASGYLTSIGKISTMLAKSVLRLRALIKAEEGKEKPSQGKIEKYNRQIGSLLRKIQEMTGVRPDLLWNSVDDFKRTREEMMPQFIPELYAIKEGGRIDLELAPLIEQAYEQIKQSLRPLPQDKVGTIEDINVLKFFHIPSYRKHSFAESSLPNFTQYAVTRIANTLIERLSDFLIAFESSEGQRFINFIREEFSYIAQHIYDLLPLPKFTSYSASLLDVQEYQGEFCIDGTEASRIHIAFVLKDPREKPSEWLTLNIHDHKKSILKKEVNGREIEEPYNSRIGRLMLGEGAIPGMPVLTYKDGKLILNLPFYVRKGTSSTPADETFTYPCRIGAVDVGLRDFAVMSVTEFASATDKGTEIARHILDGRVFDYKFEGGKFKWSNVRQSKVSNIKGRLRAIRRIIRTTQSKTSKFESFIGTLDEEKGRQLKKARTLDLMQESSPLVNDMKQLGSRLPTEASKAWFRNAFPKYIQRKQFIERLWERVNNINQQITNLVAHTIAEIAEYHRVSTVSFEDLKWSFQSKKREVGQFLAYWQVHWFYGRVQTICEGLCSAKGIGFTRVNPRNTSQNCYWCGERGDRAGAWFTCSNPKCDHLGEVQRKRQQAGKKVNAYHKINSDLNAARNIAVRALPAEAT